MAKIQKLLLLVCGISFLVIGCNNNGQAQKIDRVEVVQDFQTGAVYRYEVQKGKVDSRKPGTEDIKTATEIDFRVLSDKEGVKECSWKYGQTKVIGVSPDQIDEQTRKLMGSYQGLEVKFDIDKKGVYQELTNFEQCKVHIKNSFKLFNDNVPNKLTPEEYKKMMDVVETTYETPEILVNTYFPELVVFFNMFGETVESDSIYTSQAKFPNPFGGRSFPANVTTKLDDIRGNIASISVKLTIPINDLNSIMRETFAELSKQSDKPFNENEIPEFNMTSSSLFTYDFQKKVLNEVYSEKLVEAEGLRQIQTLKVISKN